MTEITSREVLEAAINQMPNPFAFNIAKVFDAMTEDAPDKGSFWISAYALLRSLFMIRAVFESIMKLSVSKEHGVTKDTAVRELQGLFAVVLERVLNDLPKDDPMWSLFNKSYLDGLLVNEAVSEEVKNVPQVKEILESLRKAREAMKKPSL